MNIRRLTPADATKYFSLRSLALSESPEAFGTTYEEYITRTIDAVAARLEHSPLAFTLGVFDHDEQLVGIATVTREAGTKARHKGELVGVFVTPSARGQGVAKKLILEAVHQAREMEGLEQLTLAVVTTNASAKSLYESLGFATYGVEPNALKLGEMSWDEALMVLNLVQ